MREILFKAKTISGNWVNGLLANKDDKWYISNKTGSPFAYEVRPETLCQFTGLFDGYGNEIWENDIVNYNGEYVPIKFGMYCSGFDCERYNLGFFTDFPEGSFYRKELGFWHGKVETVGNIFDNPELLQKESDFEVFDS
jgi:uncharacterized phage protein (TIGR01671 family)